MAAAVCCGNAESWRPDGFKAAEALRSSRCEEAADATEKNAAEATEALPWRTLVPRTCICRVRRRKACPSGPGSASSCGLQTPGDRQQNSSGHETDPGKKNLKLSAPIRHELKGKYCFSFFFQPGPYLERSVCPFHFGKPQTWTM